MSNRSKNYIRNSIWGILSTMASILLPFIVRTVLIYKMGIQYVGLNTLFATVLQVFSLAELGFGSALVVSMYGPVAENNTPLLCALLNFYKKVYRVIGCAIVVLGIILLPFISKLINGTYPNDINIYVLYLIYLLNTVSSYLLFAYKSSLLVAHQRNDIKNKIILICNFLQNAIQIVSLLIWGNYYAYIIWLPIATIVINLCTAVVTRKFYPLLKPSGTVPAEQIALIRKQVVALVWHKLGNTIIFSFDNIIISATLGLVTLGMYNNYYYIFNSVASIFSIVYDSIIPGIGNAMITESKESNYHRFLKFDILNKYLIGICASCLLVLYQPFILLWQGKSIMLDNMTVYLLVTLFIVWHLRRIIHTFKDAAGLWEIDRYRPIVEALVKLVLNIVLIRTMGINAVVLSTIIAMLLVGFPWDIKVFIKDYLNKASKQYYWQTLKCVIQYVAGLLIVYTVLKFLPHNTLWYFILKAVLCASLSAIIFATLYCKEKAFIEVVNLVVKHLKKRQKN
ncbi:TPA: oligosaccharide flippase family protein [Enterococcus faecium]|uniref:PST family polysaccharide transporter n=1 Tax=Enterococcus faecium (strain ATCC BAA-472 / TX0016 / DO) TaxID=333849 RepID=I3U3I8_ENTFD|nr:PST family polysaccharide transporter [Enterococcus faecium DO]EIB6813073.1 oligosaccharide flippase family protein [Enterococcus faecium]ELB21475.1 hypothetical protein OIS_03490 [Enterococcus faecium EnGen0035]EMF0318519.1 oligosaccharide flippase family protein [Enterococcus faecium]MDO8004456.1 transporter [Enterococcus faecium]